MLPALLAFGLLVVLAVIVLVKLRGGSQGARPAAAEFERPAPRVVPDLGPAPAAAAAPAPAPTGEPPAALHDFSLMTEDLIAPQRRDELRALLGQLPMPPRTLAQLLSSDFDADADSKAMAEFIMHEPLLAARVIARVNSPFYGLRSPIVSVAHAITYLGQSAVRNIAVQFVMQRALQNDNPRLKQLFGQVLDAGTIAAEVCALLAARLHFRDAGNLTTRTVLSFLGDLAVARLLPPGPAAVNWPQGLLARSTLEQQTLGASAPGIGALLMREWGLPDALREEATATSFVMVTPASGREPEAAARDALCYYCARLGEAIVLGQVRAPAEAPLWERDAPEYFQLRGYLALPALARLPALLAAADVDSLLRRLIAATQPADAA